LTENLLLNGTLLWWSVAFLDGLFSFVRHGLGVFSSGARGEDVRWMYSAKKAAVGYLLQFGKGTVELILRDWTVTWLKQEG
jgi:hypothetical protein